MRKALGVDLGMSWESTGTALLAFEETHSRQWRSCSTKVIDWPAEPLSPKRLSLALDEFVRHEGIHAVSIDGPQGWRDPNAEKRLGVGRCCEYEARTPGKTGVFGRCYPTSWLNWIRFSIEVFDELRKLNGVVPCNAVPSNPPKASMSGGYYLLECFPTSTWRTLGLTPLPGHRKAPPTTVLQFAERLRTLLTLPHSALTDHHDHLQAVVAALTGIALLGGPVVPVKRGVPAFRSIGLQGAPFHTLEGIIWDAGLRGDPPPQEKGLNSTSQ